MTRAVFLDRDGVIIKDTGYLHERDKVSFFPRVSEAVKLLNEQGFKVIVITNQAGVARGYFTEETVREINQFIQDMLAEQEAIIDRFYYCPHHIEGVVEAYRKACYCRKPNPGMLEQAARDFRIELSKSFVIGDNLIDIEAGRRVGCRTIMLNNRECCSKGDITPDYVAPDLYEAVKWILKLM